MSWVRRLQGARGSVDRRAADLGGENWLCDFYCCSVRGTEGLRKRPLCYFFFFLRDSPKRRHTIRLAM